VVDRRAHRALTSYSRKYHGGCARTTRCPHDDGTRIGAGGRAEHPARSLGSRWPSPKFSIFLPHPRAWQGHGVPGPPEQPVQLVAVPRRVGLRRSLPSTARLSVNLGARDLGTKTTPPGQPRTGRIRLVRLPPCSVHGPWDTRFGISSSMKLQASSSVFPPSAGGRFGTGRSRWRSGLDGGCELSSWGWRSTTGASGACSESPRTA